MEDSRINLRLLQDLPKTIGENVYGTIITESTTDPLANKLCCLNPGWAKGRKNCNQWEGVAAEWIRTLSKTGKKGSPSLVEIDGKPYVVKAFYMTPGQYDSSYHRSDFFNLKDLRKSMEKYPEEAQKCLGLLKFDYQYIGLSDYLNEVLIGELVHRAFSTDTSIPRLYNRIYTYSMCGRYSLILMDYADKLDLYTFSSNPDLGDMFTEVDVNVGNRIEKRTAVKPEITESILKQVASSLHFLQNTIEFIHSDLKVENVFLSSKSVTGSYRGVNLNGKVTARIADYGNCSASLRSLNRDDPKNIRLFNEVTLSTLIPGSLAGYKLDVTKSKNCVEINLRGDAKCFQGLWWKLPSRFDAKISLITAHSGMPFYRSYDWYTFMTSLMMCPHFFNSIFSDVSLKGKYWDSLWLSEEVNKVTLDVMKLHGKRPSLENTISILKKYYMKCEALDQTVELMK